MPFREIVGNLKLSNPRTYIGKAGSILIDTTSGVLYLQDGHSAGGTTTSAYVTPEQFGAVGDGLTDDSAAIQAAIDGSGDRALFFSRDYRLASGLIVDDTRATAGTRVARRWFGIGAFDAPISGEAGVRRQHTRLTFSQTTGVCVDVRGQGFSADGLFFDGDSTDVADTIKFSRTDTFEDLDSYIRGCRFRNGNRAVWHVGRGLDVQGCAFEVLNYGIYLDFPASINSDTTFGQNVETAWRAITVKNNRFHSIDQACIANLGSQAAQLTNLDVANNHTDGGSVLRFWNGHVGTNASFSGNKIGSLKSGGSGFRISGGSSFSIAGGHVSGYLDSSAVESDLPNYLIEFTGSVGQFSIAAVTFRRCVLRAITAAANFDTGSVTACTFHDFAGIPGNASRPAIYVVGNMTDVAIVGNSFSQTTGSTYSTELVKCDGTISRVRMRGNTWNTARHRLHNNIVFDVAPIRSVTTTATNYTTLPSDGVIRVTDTSAARTITLSTTRLEPGHEFTILDGSRAAGTNNITVSGVNINGSSSKAITANGGYITIKYNGSDFDIIGQNGVT